MTSYAKRHVRIGTLSNVRHGAAQRGGTWMAATLTTQDGIEIPVVAFAEKAERLLPLSDGRVQLLGYFRPKTFVRPDGEQVTFQQFMVLHSQVGHTWASLPAAELARLVWTHPVRVLAEMYGVSDVAIGKRCKSLGIDKPGRGFWAKVQNGHRPHPRGVAQPV